jgi:hypothetical protein
MEVTRVAADDECDPGTYRPAPWERVEGGVLSGPGYVYDLQNDDLLFFVSPSRMLRRRTGEEDAGGLGRVGPPSPENGRTLAEGS